ncbi:peptidoglycan-binding domain-containing protein [Fictibacillus terranigra]|uniref:Peptidoglycan-binding domain-containing protein n=1 Tax=Fictibacillus terranigra TaxID=3058424 RepID=A0ABT8E8K5_9BACL|nr:peptidoglycan-binding domain-containing protein [Fictibacillus sp. CENA-BCM004]MDN4074247.1 peptidoglycan-binding domain-containing protein [Fictibacillus sp. CENA-BCM004]
MKKIVTGLAVVLMAWGISFSTASASAPGFHHPADWDKNSILRKDARGVEVKNVQYIINVLRSYTDSSVFDSDGIFGPKTEAAVKKYQKTHHLAADGVVGPRTWDSFSKFIEKRGTNTYEPVDTWP